MFGLFRRLIRSREPRWKSYSYIVNFADRMSVVLIPYMRVFDADMGLILSACTIFKGGDAVGCFNMIIFSFRHLVCPLNQLWYIVTQDHGIVKLYAFVEE